MKQRICIDFETRSEIDITTRGVENYANDQSTEILMCGWRNIDTDESGLWLPGAPLPVFCKTPSDFILYAHNAMFEIHIWNSVGTRYFGFSRVSVDNFIDTMALAARYGLPLSLEKAGEALNLNVQKNKDGKQLIKEFCYPPYADHHGERWEKFKLYCIQDVDAEVALVKALPADHLSPGEQENYLLTQTMNQRGIGVDTKAIDKILEVSEQYKVEQFEKLPELTDGVVTKITQAARVIKFVNDTVGYPLMDDCRNSTVAELLEREDLPDVVMTILEMRAGLGLSSTGKYKRFQDMSYNGRIFGSQRYYGAHTGRMTGAGVQLLNLPRASVEDPEAEIKKFFDGSIMEANPVKSARALIRPMLKAQEGKTFIVADFSSIEYVVLEWLAGAKKNVERFREGADQYKDTAAKIFGVPYDQVTKEQRQLGKVTVLGAGYGAGPTTFRKVAKLMAGLVLTEAEAKFAISGYRNAHFKVHQFWYSAKEAFVKAVETRIEQQTHGCKFKYVVDRNKRPWLALTLPSGRSLYYREPRITEGKYGQSPAYMGYNNTIKQAQLMFLSPGRVVENIVQATARDILMASVKRLETSGYKIVLTVYDEIVCEIEEDKADLEKFCQIMCETPQWCEDLPLKADGWIGNRYKK